MTLLYFIIILGVIIFIHELGHFIFAKRSGIYIYEFSLGMGPRIFKFNRKNDETDYCLRLFPIGGFVQMAGEEINDDEDVPKDKKFSNKTFWQKFMTVVAGIMMNFLLAIILLFIVGLINGAPQNKAIVGTIDPNYPAYTSGLKEGDKILKVDGRNANTTDKLTLQLQVFQGKTIDVEVERNGVVKTIKLTPKEDEVDGQKTYRYGFQIDDEVEYGFFPALKYAFTKTFSLIHQMIFIIWYLITGQLELGSLAGPVGIYSVVGSAASSGLVSLLYLTAYISINVGFINLLPIPAFDGGRLLFLIIEKIKGSPVDPKLENTIHTIGFFLLMALMILITYNDVIRLIK
ncbi:MAG: RIP metalloprotease RseP [Bacilli bacterium]|nr:RIP metalloprotease RseP [Bacilli bacterium]